MPCPECDGPTFGTAETGAGEIVNLCADCGHGEEAPPSEVALFLEAYEGVLATPNAA
jgi:hypothetical protein